MTTRVSWGSEGGTRARRGGGQQGLPMAEPDAPIEGGKQNCGPSTEPEQWGRCGLGGRVSETLALCPHPDYAEALINPIKHVSLMDQRAKQLAALIGESEVSQGRWGAGGRQQAQADLDPGGCWGRGVEVHGGGAMRADLRAVSW